MREVGHADKSVNDRYTHPLEQAHLLAAQQTAALVRNARAPGRIPLSTVSTSTRQQCEAVTEQGWR